MMNRKWKKRNTMGAGMKALVAFKILNDQLIFQKYSYKVGTLKFIVFDPQITKVITPYPICHAKYIGRKARVKSLNTCEKVSYFV